METSARFLMDRDKIPSVPELFRHTDAKQVSMSIEIDSDSGYQTVSSESRISPIQLHQDSPGESNNIDTFDKSQFPSTTSDDSSNFLNEIMNNKDHTNEIILDTKFREFFEEKLSADDKRKFLDKLIENNYSNIPKTLVPIARGLTKQGDCHRHPDEIPSWLDREKFTRGQKFSMDNFFGLCFAELLSLFVLYSFEDGLKPMIITGNSSEPYKAFKRYLSTGSRVRNWFTSDIWTKATKGYNDIEIVRRMHENVRDKLRNLTNNEIDKAAKMNPKLSSKLKITIDDFLDCCPAPKIGQCPFLSMNYRNNRLTGLNQTEMSITQWGFVGLIVSYPKSFGVHNATDDDLDAFCHMWRGIGHRLGIEDEYNFCQGSLKEIQSRSRDILESWAKPNFRIITPEWEHMMRCLVEGIAYYTPGVEYDISLMYLCDILKLKMPRLEASMSWFSHIKYQLSKILFHNFFRFSWFRNHMNKKVNKKLDDALNFNEKKHAKLQEKSAKSLENASVNNF